MFYTKVHIWNREINIKGPVLPLSFSLGVFYGSFLGILAPYSLHGGVFLADIVVLLIMNWFGFALMLCIEKAIHHSKRYDLIINASGVTSVGIKGKTVFSLSWSEIRDYGFSYGSGSGISRYYCLYFSDSVLAKSKQEKIKKSKGHFTCITFDERTYLLKGSDILAFCKQFTDVTPFTADPDNHTGWF